MRIPRVYFSKTFSYGQLCILSGSIAHYLLHVLRLQEKDKIILFNGEGGSWYAQIIAIDKKNIKVKLLEYDPSNQESSLKIFLGQAISKKNRMDYVVQKATELGVTNIYPIISQRCEMTNQVHLKKRLLQWKLQAISACEQCGRNILPIIEKPIFLHQWLQESNSSLKLLLNPGEGQQIPKSQPYSVHLLVGSEGGFTDQEILLIKKYDFFSICLGPRVLRTETAPIVAISLLQYFFGDINV